MVGSLSFAAFAQCPATVATSGTTGVGVRVGSAVGSCGRERIGKNGALVGIAVALGSGVSSDGGRGMAVCKLRIRNTPTPTMQANARYFSLPKGFLRAALLRRRRARGTTGAS